MARTTKKILTAYCEELETVMTIEEAREAYKQHRRKFTFYCSDPECRSEFKPLIKAVNYRATYFKRAPGFSEIAGHEHSPNCSWVKGKPDFVKRGNVKADPGNESTVFEFIRDGEEAEKNRRPRRKVEAVRTWDDLEDECPRPQHGPTRGPGSIKTSALDVIVEQYLAMNKEQRKQTSLKIQGEKLTFWEIFKPIRFAKEWHTWPHIYFGKVNIYNYSRSRFFLAYFADPISDYADAYPTGEVRLRISYDELEEGGLKGLREKLLAASSDPSVSHTIYAFGSYEFKEDRKENGDSDIFFQLIPDSLKEVVITE